MTIAEYLASLTPEQTDALEKAAYEALNVWWEILAQLMTHTDIKQ